MLRGRLLIGQSGGPTAVINASLAGIIQQARQCSAITDIYGMRHGIEGVLKEDLIDLNQESDGAIQKLAHTTGAALGSCRRHLVDSDADRILRTLRSHDVRHFVYIGGNGSMDTCLKIHLYAQLAGYELQVIGVPKTIDNDLVMTHHSPGYGSAARFVAAVARDVSGDLEAMETFDDVTILETMGRNSGWLAAAAVLGKQHDDDGPHLVYVPEITFDEDRFLDDVTGVHQRLGRVLVVAGEGLRDADHQFVGQDHINTKGTQTLGYMVNALTTGVGAYLADLIVQKLGLQARFLRPGLIGRTASAHVSTSDREEALVVGQHAVKLLVQGKTGRMVTLELDDDGNFTAGDTDLEAVANKERILPATFMSASGNMPNDHFVDYARPLIGAELPEIVRLQNVPVPKNKTQHYI